MEVTLIQKAAGASRKRKRDSDFEPSSEEEENDWMSVYSKLKAFKSNKERYLSSQTPLGAWLYDQRQKYKQGALTNKQIQLLEAIGVDWKFSTQWPRKRLKQQEQPQQVN